MILRDKEEDEPEGAARPRPGWGQLPRLPQTWGTISARTLTDPVWLFVTDWFPIYLVAKGIKLEEGLFAFWIPFVAADLGNFFGGIGVTTLIPFVGMALVLLLVRNTRAIERGLVRKI